MNGIKNMLLGIAIMLAVFLLRFWQSRFRKMPR